MKLYKKYAKYFSLLTPKEHYAREANYYSNLFSGKQTILELGSGGGHNAYYLKKHFAMTLVDISEEMISCSKQLNPECTHIIGDMRSLFLEKKFDVVFIHDAIMHINNQDDLYKVMQTAYKHLSNDGICLICPDFIAENFIEGTESGGTDAEDGSGIRYLEWRWQPLKQNVETKNIYYVDMIYAIKDQFNNLTTDHDRGENGLFKRELWLALLKNVGFEPTSLKDDHTISNREIFLGKKQIK